jgi:hypothetical protein
MTTWLTCLRVSLICSQRMARRASITRLGGRSEVSLRHHSFGEPNEWGHPVVNSTQVRITNRFWREHRERLGGLWGRWVTSCFRGTFFLLNLVPTRYSFPSEHVVCFRARDIILILLLPRAGRMREVVRPARNHVGRLRIGTKWITGRPVLCAVLLGPFSGNSIKEIICETLSIQFETSSRCASDIGVRLAGWRPDPDVGVRLWR